MQVLLVTVSPRVSTFIALPLYEHILVRSAHIFQGLIDLVHIKIVSSADQNFLHVLLATDSGVTASPPSSSPPQRVASAAPEAY